MSDAISNLLSQISLGQAQAIERAADEATQAITTFGVLPLPDTFHVHDLEKYMPSRRRMTGTMFTSSADSFASYIKAHHEEGSSTVFVHDNKLSATAVLNLGNNTEPGHCDNQAQLDLIHTAAYTALLTINGKPLAQRDAAEFLEDWSDHLAFFQGGTPLQPSQAISAVRRLNIEAVRKLESVSESLSESTSAFEQVTASSKEPLPDIVYFTCPPAEDLVERTFVLRLHVVTGDKLHVCLRIQRLQSHQEEMALELSNRITQALDGQPVAVVRGQFKKG